MLRLILQSVAFAFVLATMALVAVRALQSSQPSDTIPAKLSNDSRYRKHEAELVDRHGANYRTAMGCATGAIVNTEFANDRTNGEDPQEFQIRIAVEGADLPTGFTAAIDAGARYSYAFWREWLGKERLQASLINIRFIGDDARFDHIYNAQSPEGWTTTGFYRIRSNEALIRYTDPHIRNALATTFHEVAHLIAAWHLGPTPPWLNEGLAEYFETMRVANGQVEFHKSATHERILRQTPPTPLPALITLSRSEWADKDAALRYASAWSLIRFLFDTAEGQQTLTAVIHSAYSQRCDVETHLETALGQYPGGLSRLEQDWNTSLAQLKRTPVTGASR